MKFNDGVFYIYILIQITLLIFIVGMIIRHKKSDESFFKIFTLVIIGNTINVLMIFFHFYSVLKELEFYWYLMAERNKNIIQIEGVENALSKILVQFFFSLTFILLLFFLRFKKKILRQ